MHVSILTLFPDLFVGITSTSIIKRAIEKKLLTVTCVNIRDFASDTYKSVDGHPYGGGTGMLMRVDVIDAALQAAQKTHVGGKTVTVLLDPQGIPYKQTHAKALSQVDHLILVCGHYEGVDERVRQLVDQEISIGDYVLTGGEIPAMVILDSVTRLIPDVLTRVDATEKESFTTNSLEYPQYTQPSTYKNMAVPDVLLSGHHANINAWRKLEAKKKTKRKRPDLLTEKTD